MTSILIVEDHESMRNAIASAFSETGRYCVVGEVGNADLAELYCERMHPDLIFMDVCTEGNASGLSAADAVKKRFPEIKIIVMTAFDEISYIPRAKAAGADGFVYKTKSLSFFIEVADKIMAGETCFPEIKTIPVPKGETPLSGQELAVLRLMCKHMTAKEIAEELYIAESTVKYHKRNMLEKTGFANSLDLAFYMISNGWINPLY